MAEGERRLAAIMFTDVVGYTALSQRNEALALELLEDHRLLLRPIIAEHNGREIKTIGDAFLVEFASALEAVECATGIQSRLHDLNEERPPEKKILLRIGIHLGDVVHSKNDVYGDAVNVASRVEPIASPGGICVTEHVYDDVRNKLRFPLTSLGDRELRNVDNPVHVYKVVLPWREPTVDIKPLKRRVAVLPFLNISPDPTDEFFADGLTEELIARLSRLSGLDVIARTSVMGYKNKETSASQIGRELGAGTLLEGSVRKAGNRIRVTVQLIDSSSMGHLWAENYDRDLTDIFSVQSDIAEQVAQSMAVRLLPKERKELEKEPTADVAAYTLYLKGRQIWFEFSESAFKRAIPYFERAIEADSGFALAYAGLADCYSLLGDFGYLPQTEAISKAESAARKAVELDENLAEAHMALAPPRYHKYDWRGTEAELLKAIELKPSYAIAHAWYGVLLQVTGRLDSAYVEYKRACELDPLSFRMKGYLGSILDCTRRYDEAIDQFDKILDSDPTDIRAHAGLGFAYLQKQRFDEAIAEMEKVVAFSEPGDFTSLSYLGVVLAEAGRTAEARKVVKDLETASARRYVAADLVAAVYLALGDMDKGFRLLNQAIDELCSVWVMDLKASPFFDFCREDDRFKDLLTRLGLASP